MLDVPLLTAAFDAFKILEMRRRLLFTLGMLAASRFIAHVRISGPDLTALQRVFQTNQLAGFFDLFSGGALSSLAVAALASIRTSPLRSCRLRGGSRASWDKCAPGCAGPSNRRLDRIWNIEVGVVVVHEMSLGAHRRPTHQPAGV